jgi:hypothetical protein
MGVPVWLFAVTVAWAVTASVFLFYRNPLPFPDRGHRCYPVPSEHAARTVVTIFRDVVKLPERFTFDSGAAVQTILWDNTTAIMQFSPAIRALGIPLNSISVAVDKPVARAREAAACLVRDGFSAVLKENVDPELGDKLVVLVSNAFEDWALVFRRHALAMGKPPNLRKLVGS